MANRSAGTVDQLNALIAKAMHRNKPVVMDIEKPEGRSSVVLTRGTVGRLVGDKVVFGSGGRDADDNFFAQYGADLALQVVYAGRTDLVDPHQRAGVVKSYLMAVSLALEPHSPYRDQCYNPGARTFTVRVFETDAVTGVRTQFPGEKSLHVRQAFASRAVGVYNGSSEALSSFSTQRGIYEFVGTYGCNSPEFRRLEQNMLKLIQ